MNAITTVDHKSRANDIDKAVGAQVRFRRIALGLSQQQLADETGVTVFDDEFMAHIALPDGQTVGEWVRPQIEQAYENGDMPKLLPWAGGHE